MKEKDCKSKEPYWVDIVRQFHQECAGADNQTDKSIEPLMTMLAKRKSAHPHLIINLAEFCTPVELVKMASELLAKALDKDANNDCGDRDAMLAAMAVCPGHTDHFMATAMSRTVFGRLQMEKALGGPHPSIKPEAPMDPSEQLAQAIRSLNSVMLHHQTPTPFPADSVQLGGLECMINQAAKELGGLVKKFLAITLVRSKDGCEFVQQALNAFENQNQVIIDRLSQKLDAALSALNDVLTDPEVPPPDCSHPVGDWLADEITNLTRGVVDQYIAKSLATFETGRNLMRDALDQSQS